MIDIMILGHPAPQGSKRYVGHGISIESCKALKPWRQDIRQALIKNGEPIERFEGAVSCELYFIMPRPKSTPKRKTPPAMKKPDLDKLCRAVFDAVKSANVIEDDSRIVSLSACKRLAEHWESPGLRLCIFECEDITQEITSLHFRNA